MSECIIWTKSKSRAGYGIKNVNKKRHYVHRLVAAEKYGDITGKVVRHTCDTPSCVNPDHLLIGTQADNMNDAKIRNRMYRGGPNNPHRCLKIQDEQLDEIKKLYSTGRYTQQAIAEMYNVNQSTIYSVVSGRRKDKR